MEEMGESVSVERLINFQSNTSNEDVSVEELHQDGKIIPWEHLSLNSSKKRKPEESMEAIDQNTSNENNECEDVPKRRKRNDSVNEQIPLNQTTDELDLMCKVWTMELRRMPLDQQLFARKAVSDVIFEANLGQLNKDSVKINHSTILQNYMPGIREEQGKTCACPSAWQQPQERSPTSSSQLYPGQPHCYSKTTWKGNLSTPHRPPFFVNYSNRFVAPGTLNYPRSPRIGYPMVITTAMKNITTAAIVMMTPSLISSTVPTTTILGSSRINTVNIPPYRVDNSTNTSSSHADPHLSTPNHISTTVSVNGTTDASTNTSIPSKNNLAISYSESTPRIEQATKPTVNASTTPTINTLCDVHMDTVTTDN